MGLTYSVCLVVHSECHHGRRQLGGVDALDSSVLVKDTELAGLEDHIYCSLSVGLLFETVLSLIYVEQFGLLVVSVLCKTRHA